jgi:hypothetical protein
MPIVISLAYDSEYKRSENYPNVVRRLNFCISTSRSFIVQNEITRHYSRFNAEGSELTVRLTAPPAARAATRDPARYFANSVDELSEYSLRHLEPGIMVVISIHNADNQQDGPIMLSFREE